MFITFEGIDFCGKSTQVSMLSENLAKHSIPAVALRDPGGTAISEKIRDVLLHIDNHEMHVVTELLLYEAARSQMVQEKIKPALKDKKVVLMDRFFDSTTAYQGYGRGIDLQTVERANSVAAAGLVPDLTLVVDISVVELERRKAVLGDHDRLEKEDATFFQRVRDGYLTLAKQNPRRIRVLNGEKPPDDLQAEILSMILKLLKR